MEQIKKSILIITLKMVPYSDHWGSCQRMYFFAEYLQNSGCNVHVLHLKEKYQGYFGVSPNFHLIPIISGFSSPATVQTVDSLKSKVFSFCLNTTKKIVNKLNLLSLEKFFFNEPISGMGILGYLFSRNAKKTLINVIKEQSIKSVIISGPPFSIFLSVKTIKKYFPHVAIILDYRDPWNTYSFYLLPQLIEKFCLKNAKKIVFFNEKMMDDTIKKFSLSKQKCEYVSNGFSKYDWDAIDKEKLFLRKEFIKPLIISYIGAVSFKKGGYRDFSSFFTAFEHFQKNRNVLLRLVGVNDQNTALNLKNQFLDKIEIIPMVDHKKSLEFMYDSDVLFHVHTDSQTGLSVMAGKLFDYIRSGKIIFVISSQNNAYSVNFVNTHKLGLTCLAEPLEILKKLEIMYKHWEMDDLNALRQDTDLNLDMYSREFQNSRYLNIINEVCKNESN